MRRQRQLPNMRQFISIYTNKQHLQITKSRILSIILLTKPMCLLLLRILLRTKRKMHLKPFRNEQNSLLPRIPHFLQVQNMRKQLLPLKRRPRVQKSHLQNRLLPNLLIGKRVLILLLRNFIIK